MTRKAIPKAARIPKDPASVASKRSSARQEKQTSPSFAVMERARDMGLMTANTQQIGARLPTKLLEQAKKRTGITSITDLLAFALANVALEDDFAAAFAAARGLLDPDLDVGF